jgi:threonine dehydrogenase-like Zn-dependent dehydrogenase
MPSSPSLRSGLFRIFPSDNRLPHHPTLRACRYTRMRALRYDGSKVLLDRNARAPSLAPGEALIRPTLVGVCSSDLEIARGGTTFHGTLGHEFVGVVEEINIPADAPAHIAAKKSLKGKRVVGGINIICGHCDLCRAGLSIHCRERSVLGISGRDGCFADRFTLPLVNLYEVPASVDDDHAVMCEPLASAIHAGTLVRAHHKPFVTVLGDGRLGLLTAQVLARQSTSVRLLGKHPEKLALCDRWGIKHRHIDEVGRRQDQDVVIDCTGSASGLALAMQLVRPRGTIILKSTVTPVPIPVGAPVPGAGHPAWSVPVNLAPIVLSEINLIGSRCGQIGEAVEYLAQGGLNITGLITKRAKLDEGVSTLDAAKSGQIKVVMAV